MIVPVTPLFLSVSTESLPRQSTSLKRVKHVGKSLNIHARKKKSLHIQVHLQVRKAMFTPALDAPATTELAAGVPVTVALFPPGSQSMI